MSVVRSLGQLQGLRALRHRNYRLYWTGQLISLIGTWMQQVAQAWLVLSLTNDPLMLGLVATAQYGPVLAFGLFGGVLADALPKRRTIILTQVILMVLAVVLGLLTLTGTAQVWHVMILAVLLGFTGVVDMPTRQAFIFEMVGREDLPNAVALNASVYNGARVVGPAIAGLTIAAVGVPAAFLLNGLSFVAVIACLLAMRTTELRPVAQGAMPRTVRAVFANLGEGLGYIRRTPTILIAILVLGFVSTAGMNYSVVIPPLARDVLGAGPEGYGFLMSAGGIGSVVAALALAFGRRPSTRSMLAGALALGVLETLLAVSTWMPLSLACMFGMGLGGLAMSMSANTQIQMGVPDRLRGRVMSVYTTIFAGTTPIGGLIFGALASGLGTEPAIAIGGVVSMAIALTAFVVAWRWGLVGRARTRLAAVPASHAAAPAVKSPAGASPAPNMSRHQP